MKQEVTKVNPDKVRALREARGFSREQLAVSAGISGRTLATIELGDGGPHRQSTLRVIAMALDCEVSDFRDEEPVAA